MEIAGYIAALIIGLSLGLIGGGGSILTVPVLVYLFSVEPVLATAYSLFIVGVSSLAGSLSHVSLGNIEWRTAIVFGLPSVISVFLTRLFIMPAIPDPVFTAGSYSLSKATALLILFALIMLPAAYSMIKKGRSEKTIARVSRFNYPLIITEGVVVGTITGLVGAGGGFLIIPALVILAGLPMKKAIGTSLIIIAAKSLVGFTGDLHGNERIDWHFLFLFTAIAVAGILLGALLSRKVSDERLKPIFGWFVLAMGFFIIVKELLP